MVPPRFDCEVTTVVEEEKKDIDRCGEPIEGGIWGSAKIRFSFVIWIYYFFVSFFIIK